MASVRPKIPRDFEIKGHEWRVHYKYNLAHEDGTVVYGLCHAEERLIELDRLMTPEQKWRYFFHELFHAVLFELHLVAPADGGLTLVQEGVLVEGLTDVLLTLFDVKWKRKPRRRKQ